MQARAIELQDELLNHDVSACPVLQSVSAGLLPQFEPLQSMVVMGSFIASSDDSLQRILAVWDTRACGWDEGLLKYTSGHPCSRGYASQGRPKPKELIGWLPSHVLTHGNVYFYGRTACFPRGSTDAVDAITAQSKSNKHR